LRGFPQNDGIEVEVLGVKLCCVLPAFNEEKTVAEVAGEAGKYVDEVIVVDDGSRDSTARVAANSGAVVVQHRRNMGKGAALRSGFKEAVERRADIVITLDADGEHNPKDIPKLVDLVQSGKVDIAVGSRLQNGAEKGSFLRRLSRAITTLVLRMLFDVHLSDTQSGFRCLSRKAIETLHFESDSFVAESEILIDAVRKDLKVGEVPVAYVHVGGGFPVLKETALFISLCLRRIIQPQ